MPEFLNVSSVLENLQLKDSLMGAEFGCGSAMFALALAKRLSKGRVYALDIQEEKLSAVKGRAMIEKVTNIMPVVCDLEKEKGSTLHTGTVDVVLIPNLLFQVENKHAILTEAVRILKNGGQLLVIDWSKEGPGSPISGLVAPETVKRIAQEAGIVLKKEFAAGDYHYALVFTK